MQHASGGLQQNSGKILGVIRGQLYTGLGTIHSCTNVLLQHQLPLNNSTTHTTPYELLYGMKPRTPSLPATDIQRKFYGESFASKRLQILQKAREIAKANIEKSQEKYKQQHDKKAEPHTFSIGQQVWCSQTDFLNVNKKLAPKWIGPATIIEIN
jgi:hypothetical protein